MILLSTLAFVLSLGAALILPDVGHARGAAPAQGVSANTEMAAVMAATPAKPTGFVATQQDEQVWLTWDYQNDPSITAWQFWIRKGTEPAQGWSDIPNSNSTTIAYLVTDLDNREEYRFRVRAINPDGASAQSLPDTATPHGIHFNAPLNPRRVTVAAGDSQITLSWHDPNDPSILKYQYGQKAGEGDFGGWNDINSSSWGKPNATSYTVTGLTNDTSYSFRVRAVNLSRWGVTAITAGATPQAGAVTNYAPAFAAGTVRRSVIENSAEGTTVGSVVTATDADSGDTLTYSLSGADAASFTIGSSTGQITVGSGTTLDYESSNKSYTVAVLVSDGKDSGGNADTTVDDAITVTINVTDVDEQPSLSGSSAVSYAENGTASVASYTATDPESATVSWTLSGDDSDDFSISAGGVLSFNASPDFETPADADTNNAYLVTVEASDGTTDKVTLAVTVTVTNVDEPGAVALSPAQPVVGTALTATLADPDGSITATTWQWASSTDGSTAWTDISSATSASYTPVTGDEGKYLRATAAYTDSHGTGKTAQAVSGNQVQAAPVVNTAPDFGADTATRSIAENAAAVANVGAAVTATDGDNDTLTYSLSGTDQMSFDIVSTSGQLQTKAALDYESRNSYEVVVTATDPSNAADTITVTINVTNVDESGTVTFSSDQPQVAMALNATLTDPDGSISATTWQWASSTDGSEGSWTDINHGSSGRIYPLLDLAGKYLRATVSYTDSHGAGKSAQAVSANVVQGTGSLSIAPAGPVSLVEGGSAQTFTVTGLGVVDSVFLYYILFSAGGAANDLTLTDSDGSALSISLELNLTQLEASIVGSEDFTWTFNLAAITDTLTENGETLQIWITAHNDGGDALAESNRVTVNLGDAAITNAAPTFGQGANTTRTIAENSATGANVGLAVTATDGDNDTLTYSLSGTDEASFAIGSATGQITVGSGTSLDYESGTKSYSVIVSVSDGKNSEGNADTTVDDTITVTINVTNAEETGTVALSPAQPVVGTALTATLADPDGSITATTWQWASSTDGSTAWTDISSATSASYTPVTGDEGKYLRATAAYTDSHGTGKTAQAVSGNQVQAAPVVNTAPVFDDGESVTRTVDENTAAGTNVGAAVTATDAGDTLTYSLSGTDAASFAIDGSAGQITVGSGTSLDYESKNSYEVTVTATDTSNATDTITVAINVTNVDEQPSLSGSSAVSYAENGTASVASYTATDPESATVSWTLSGDDSDDFSISAGGVLSFNASPDFETPADADTNNAYLVTVEASDGTTDKVTLAVTVTVTNVDEPGAVALSPAQPVVGTALTATLADPDGSITATTWQWASSTDGSTAWTDISSATSASYTPVTGDEGKYLRATAAYTDSHGTGKTAQAVSGNQVQAAPVVNTAPVFDDGESVTRTVDENTAAGTNVGAAVTATDAGDTLTYSLSGTDAASFAIDGSAGQITVGNGTTLDYESGTKSYSVIVSVSDGKNSEGNADTTVDDAITVVINVTDVEEAGTVVLSPAQPVVGTALTATLTDPDGSISATTWVWASSSDWDVSAGTGTWTTISGETSTDTTSAYTLVDADLNNYLRATASYTDPEGSGKSAQAVSANAVQPAPVVNTAPAFPAATAARSIAENTTAGANVGDPVTATDTDTLTYSLSGTNAASFAIGTSSGQITVGTGTTLDFESKNSYEVVVTAADPSSATDTITVTINVTDVNESPTATDDTATITEDTAVDINVVANDTDPDAGTTLSVTAVSRAPASGTAVITSGTATTVTYTPNAGFRGEDSFDYTVSDGTATATGTVKVLVYKPAPTTNSTQSTQAIPVGAETDAVAPGGRVTVEFPQGASAGTPFQARVDDAANPDCTNLPSGQVTVACVQVDLFKLDATEWDTADGTPFDSANLRISISNTPDIQNISVYRREDSSDSWTSIPRCAGSAVECFTVSSGRVMIQNIPDFSQFAVLRPRMPQVVPPTATATPPPTVIPPPTPGGGGAATITRRRRGGSIVRATATPAPVVVATPAPTEMVVPATDTPVPTSVASAAVPQTPELPTVVRPPAAPPTPAPTQMAAIATPTVAPAPTDSPAAVGAIPSTPVPAGTTALPPAVAPGGGFPLWLIAAIVVAVLVAGGLGFGAWRMLRPQ